MCVCMRVCVYIYTYIKYKSNYTLIVADYDYH